MWSDRETDEDCLGFAANVEVLAEFCTCRELSPLTLGIFGHWGSGKTSLMSMVKARISETHDDMKAPTLWFNAWRYEGREEAQSALIHAIIACLKDKRTLKDEANDLAKQILDGASVMKLAKFIAKSAFTMTPDIGAFLGCFKEESEKLAETMERFEKDFTRLLDQIGVDCIVVFIDDLDRCSSEKVIETFETIKLFLNTPRCTFVIGADPDRIEAAVGDVFGTNEVTRRDYLEKIVHIPFQIPEQSLRDIGCYVGMLVLQRYLDEEGRKILLGSRGDLYNTSGDLADVFKTWAGGNAKNLGESMTEAMEALGGILPHAPTLARGLRGNPRQIKRFLNILALRERLAAANELEVDRAYLIKLSILEYTWGNFFRSLIESVDPSTGESDFLRELLTIEMDKLAETDSKSVTDAAAHPGLIDFLRAVPPLPGDLNLLPYLFLAQTSLGATPRQPIAPVEEAVRGLVLDIASADRLRSSAAAKKAAAQEPQLVQTVVRRLIAELFTPTDEKTRTHLITGLDYICQRHPGHYTAVVEALERFDPTGSDAIAVVGSTLLKNAQPHMTVSENLVDRFAGGALSRALTGTRKPGVARRRER